jgi:maltooligosyltrehalose trehalohydrolase
VLSASAFALRFFTPDHVDDRVLIVNLGADLSRTSFAEPLLAPPLGHDWELRWSSDDATYGGNGTPELFPDGCWIVPAESAVVLRPGPQSPRIPLPLFRRTA